MLYLQATPHSCTHETACSRAVATVTSVAKLRPVRSTQRPKLPFARVPLLSSPRATSRWRVARTCAVSPRSRRTRPAPRPSRSRGRSRPPPKAWPPPTSQAVEASKAPWGASACWVYKCLGLLGVAGREWEYIISREAVEGGAQRARSAAAVPIGRVHLSVDWSGFGLRKSFHSTRGPSPDLPWRGGAPSLASCCCSALAP